MRKLMNAAWVLALVFLWATPAFAQEGREQPGQVIFGSNRNLEAGDIIQGDLVIFGGNLRMAAGSRIEGDAVIFGGNGDIDGEIRGDLAVIGGNVRLGSSARVDGDVAAIGGKLDRDENAYVGGDLVETTDLDLSRIPLPPFRVVTPPPDWDRGFRFEPMNQFFRIVMGFVQALVVALVIAAIGLLTVLFLPEHSQTIGQAVRQAAPASFGFGLLTLIVGVAGITLLVITCCLAPVGVLAALALVLTTLYGWIVIGYLLGERMVRAIQSGKEATPAVAAPVGVFTVTLVQQGLIAMGNIPCLGFLFWLLGAGLWLLVASTGLGAVILTRFGTQSYTGTSPTRRPPAPLPPLSVVPPAEPASLEPPAETESQPSATNTPRGEPNNHA